MSLKTEPIVRVQMLIRRPVAEVYRAFVDPEITSNFWYSRATGPLERGAKVTWYWEMYGVSANVTVKELEPNRRIVIEWPTPVEWVLTEESPDTTFVVITASGFSGDDDAKVAEALDSMGGFSLVIAACKAYLEHGIQLNIVADRAPHAHVKAP